ncbi:hypothetical protein MA16_Dca009040 [Dendrobium catenatum]|uniref:Matrin-type domain-containing protein n=1 Tax=Dendrobium catenatum TaxID=906689 RepID=A0A2I0VRC4_9ASPA|nr:hypothetical protein MA16_Dca009040 [Dendrobium catenatum]
MTEYWVSQGNKWCDFCKIYISNNPASIRTHEIGQRHKDNVAQRLSTMRKESAAKEKEKKEAAKALEQIEEKAKRCYQKDMASFQQTHKSSSNSSALRDNAPDKSVFSATSGEWEHDAASGYYYNLASGYHYDPNSCLFYSSSLGKWVTQDVAFPSSRLPKTEASSSKSSAVDRSTAKLKGDKAPGLVVSSSLNPMRSVKGAPSSIAVNKRKREGEKTKGTSKEEIEALKAREAARKRVDQREKPMLGLYRSY